MSIAVYCFISFIVGLIVGRFWPKKVADSAWVQNQAKKERAAATPRTDPCEIESMMRFSLGNKYRGEVNIKLKDNSYYAHCYVVGIEASSYAFKLNYESEASKGPHIVAKTDIDWVKWEDPCLHL